MLVALGLVLALVPGCRVARSLDLVSIPEAKAWNLEQLHTPQTEHRYSADLQGDVTFVMRRLFSGIGPGEGLDARRGEPKPVRDPNRRCHENLLELATFTGADPLVSSLQVEWAARLAVQDPWVLSREAATLLLGRAGARLGLEWPPPAPSPEPPVGPERLGELLAGLVRAFREELAAGGGSGRLAAACAELGSLEFELEGGRRALRTVRTLLAASGTRPQAAPLRALSGDLQRHLVHLGLASALADPAPRVRAAALVARVEAAGPGTLGPLLERLEEQHADLVAVTALRLVAEHGLPPPGPGLEGERYAELRERWLAQLHYHAVQHRQGWVRVNAMRALGRATGGELVSLREEDWVHWWESRRAPGAAEG